MFDSRPGLPPGAAKVCDIHRASQLQIRRWCHGEIRVSLTPRYEPRKHLRLVPGGELPPPLIRVITGAEKPFTTPEDRISRSLARRFKLGDRSSQVPGYGGLTRKTILTRHAGRVLFECGAISERHCGITGAFLTGTVAGSTKVALQTVANYSAWLIERVRKWVKHHVNQRAHVFGVWEPQKRGALHLHLCGSSLDVDGIAYLLHMFHDYWRALLIKLSNKSGVDLFKKNNSKTWLEDTSKPWTGAGWLRSSPAKYLAKYCGKNARKEVASAVYYPSSWLTVDYATKREAVGERVRVICGGVSVAFARSVFNQAITLAEPVADNLWQYGNPVFAEDKTEIIELSQDNLERYWQAVIGLLDTSCIY